jgi:hypothetical protein
MMRLLFEQVHKVVIRLKARNVTSLQLGIPIHAQSPSTEQQTHCWERRSVYFTN